MKAWDVQVVLCSEDVVEMHAMYAGEPRAAGQRLSVGETLRQIEHWLESTPGSDMYLAVRTPDGAWRQIATRRWRVAAYFVLTHYERSCVLAPRTADASESVSQPSGVVAKDLPDASVDTRSRKRSS